MVRVKTRKDIFLKTNYFIINNEYFGMLEILIFTLNGQILSIMIDDNISNIS